ncbi:MAG TPA: VOC family protein [Phycisphaerales bacterium]|nr:VOC family protein [Phycisphaerales bacterium]
MHELDHIFLLTDVNADVEARILACAGLTEGPPNRHAGQGTACRRFFLRNAYIELLWICDQEEASSPMCTPTGLLTRWRGRASGACPIGICTRPARVHGEHPRPHVHPASPPMPAWKYEPPYLPRGFSIDMALDAHDPAVPLRFHLGFAQAPGESSRVPLESLVHPSGFESMSRVEIAGPCTWIGAGCLPAPGVEITLADRWSLRVCLERGEGANPAEVVTLLP